MIIKNLDLFDWTPHIYIGKNCHNYGALSVKPSISHYYFRRGFSSVHEQKFIGNIPKERPWTLLLTKQKAILKERREARRLWGEAYFDFCQKVAWTPQSTQKRVTLKERSEARKVVGGWGRSHVCQIISYCHRHLWSNMRLRCEVFVLTLRGTSTPHEYSWYPAMMVMKAPFFFY